MYIDDELLEKLYTKERDKLTLLLGLYLKADKDGVVETSRSEMVKYTGLTERRYRTNLAKLDNVQVNVQQTTKITICDIASYRASRPATVLDDVQLKAKEQEKKENFPTPLIKKEKDKEKENDSIKGARKIFIPPTIEEVRAYIQEKGYNIDADQWWNFYNAKNWMIGKNKMSKWRSAVATWNNRRQQPAPPVQRTEEIGQVYRQSETDYTQGWD